MIIRNIHWIIMITSLISIVKPDEKPVDKKLIVDRYNGYRRNASIKLNVSNMWELEWDENLVKKAFEITSEIDRTNSNSTDFYKIEQGSDYRFFFTNTAYKFLAWEGTWLIDYPSFEKFKETLMENWRNDDQLFYSHIEITYPSQKKIGCIQYMVTSLAGHTHLLDFNTFCLLGPHGYADSRALIKFGPPASNCTDGHGEDGLCVPGPAPQTLPPFKLDGDDDEEDGTKRKKKKKKKKDEDEEEYDLVLILTNAVRGSGVSVVFGLLIVVFLNGLRTY